MTGDSDVGRRLHVIGCIDDVILQVGELSDVAIIPGDDRACIGIDVEVVQRPQSKGFEPLPKRWVIERTFG